VGDCKLSTAYYFKGPFHEGIDLVFPPLFSLQYFALPPSHCSFLWNVTDIVELGYFIGEGS
jgi:hypothetical protein